MCVYAYIYIHTHTDRYTYIYICTYSRVKYVRMFTCVYRHMSASSEERRARIRTLSTCVYTYIYICMWSCGLHACGFYLRL